MEILKKYLEWKNESVSAFAKRAKISQPTIWRIINGKTKRVSPDIALLIEKATKGEIKVMSLLYPGE